MGKFVRLSAKDRQQLHMGNRTAVGLEVGRVSSTKCKLLSAWNRQGPRENRLRVPINIGRNHKSMVEMPSAQ